jgi:hypothetical protein
LVDLDQLTAVDQVWATVITTIPLQMGFLYLVAIMDLFSRHVFSMEAELLMEPTLRPHPIPPTSELMM